MATGLAGFIFSLLWLERDEAFTHMREQNLLYDAFCLSVSQNVCLPVFRNSQVYLPALCMETKSCKFNHPVAFMTEEGRERVLWHSEKSC